MMESQKSTRDSRDRVLLIVDVCHESAQLVVDEIRKTLVPNTGHGISDHFHRHSRKLQTEEQSIKEREC
jgi:hypothetical protein